MTGMPDIFRPEVLAAFMQQVVDEPQLPILYMSTVSFDMLIYLDDWLIAIPGDLRRDSSSVLTTLCLEHATYASHHQKDLDFAAAMGGFHSMCQSYTAAFVRRTTSTAQRSLPSRNAQATNPTGAA